MRRHMMAALFAGASLLPARAYAGQQDAQLWLTQSVVVRLGDTLRLSQETDLRFSDRSGGFTEAETILLAGINVAPGVTMWTGYVHDPLYDGGRFHVMEHRFREQINFDDIMRLGPGLVSLRARLEQRWREGNVGTAWRLRPIIRYAIPLGAAKTTSLQLSHESFIDLNRTSFQVVSGEDRMRNAIALRTVISRIIALECGYLSQYRIIPGAADQIDHAMTVSVSFAL